MDNFTAAFDHIITVEGAGYTNRVGEDKGGPTKFGITQRTYTSYLGRTASIADVKTMTEATARAIYRAWYWDLLSLSRLPKRLAVVVFDQAVNRSPRVAAIRLQSILRVTQDGVLGPQTMLAIASADERDLIWEFCRESLRSYIRITQADPSQLVNLQGWSNRVFRLVEDYVLA